MAEIEDPPKRKTSFVNNPAPETNTDISAGSKSSRRRSKANVEDTGNTATGTDGGGSGRKQRKSFVYEVPEPALEEKKPSKVTQFFARKRTTSDSESSPPRNSQSMAFINTHNNEEENHEKRHNVLSFLTRSKNTSPNKSRHNSSSVTEEDTNKSHSNPTTTRFSIFNTTSTATSNDPKIIPFKQLEKKASAKGKSIRSKTNEYILGDNPIVNPPREVSQSTIRTKEGERERERESLIKSEEVKTEPSGEREREKEREREREREREYGRSYSSVSGGDGVDKSSRMSVTESSFSPATPLSLLVPRGTEQYIAMPEIPDDLKVHVQAKRCFQMQDNEIEPLYREKLRPLVIKDRSKADIMKDEQLEIQRKLITKLQTGLCCLHMNKKRFVQECCGVEDRYQAMLRKSYALLRDANRELHITQKKLQVAEMNVIMKNNETRRRASEVMDATKLLQIEDKKEEVTPVVETAIALVDNQKKENEEIEIENKIDKPLNDRIEEAMIEASLKEEREREKGEKEKNKIISPIIKLSEKEILTDLKSYLVRTQSISIMINNLQSQLLIIIEKEEKEEKDEKSVYKENRKKNIKKQLLPSLLAAKLLKLQKLLYSLKVDIEQSNNISI